jgi:hypothetical protein
MSPAERKQHDEAELEKQKKLEEEKNKQKLEEKEKNKQKLEEEEKNKKKLEEEEKNKKKLEEEEKNKQKLEEEEKNKQKLEEEEKNKKKLEEENKKKELDDKKKLEEKTKNQNNNNNNSLNNSLNNNSFNEITTEKKEISDWKNIDPNTEIIFKKNKMYIGKWVDQKESIGEGVYIISNIQISEKFKQVNVIYTSFELDNQGKPTTISKKYLYISTGTFDLNSIIPKKYTENETVKVDWSGIVTEVKLGNSYSWGFSRVKIHEISTSNGYALIKYQSYKLTEYNEEALKKDPSLVKYMLLKIAN